MCPRYEAAMELLGKRWTGLIIRMLMAGPMRFSAMRDQVERLSDRLLSERLKELEAAGVVVRRVYPETPVRIEYELTPMGREMEPIVAAIQAWAERWIDGSALGQTGGQSGVDLTAPEGPARTAGADSRGA
jgi:DNA-binding HxlR family transcriptional regulator